VSKALGLEGEEEVISNGKFMAVYEYDQPTGFYPTAQTEKLRDVGEYVKCEDLHGIRIGKMGVEQVLSREGEVCMGERCEESFDNKVEEIRMDGHSVD
jgi:hypothetical protein